MPIRPGLRWFYPIDWPQISRAIRFDRAGGRCKVCSRPHGNDVLCLPDGRWLDANQWGDGDGRGNACATPFGAVLDQLRATHVILAPAHLDNNPGNNSRRNLKCLCQRCHMLHDRPYHRAQRWLTYRMRRALSDLFTGPHPARIG